MSRTGGMTGAGGYGGISTLNQRDVRPKYAPHMTISTRMDHCANCVVVKCLDCGQEWSNPRELAGYDDTPAKCEKPEPANKADRGDREYRP